MVDIKPLMKMYMKQQNKPIFMTLLFNYLNNTNSFARKTAGVNTTGQKGCRLDYTLNLDTDFGLDFLRVDAVEDVLAGPVGGPPQGQGLALPARLDDVGQQVPRRLAAHRASCSSGRLMS